MATMIEDSSCGWWVFGDEYIVWCSTKEVACAVQRDLDAGLPPFPGMPRKAAPKPAPVVVEPEIVDDDEASPAPGIGW